MKRPLAPAVVGLALAVGLAACAKRVVPPIPEGEDYVYPAGRPGELSAEEAGQLREAWAEVLTGDTARAGRRYETLLKRRPDLVPAETGRAYAHLRAGRLEEAASAFAAVLERRPEDLSALVGAGSTAFRRGDLEGAVGFYRRALEAAPDDVAVRKRVAALKLQVTERHMSRAQSAVERGDTRTAAEEYAAVLETAPEVAGVRLALAELLVVAGDRPGAVDVLAADPTSDRQLALRRAALLVEDREFARATEVYAELLAHDPGDAEARAGHEAAREGLELLSMPEEYRRIPGLARITREDLAALIAVRVGALARLGPGEPRVAVDIGASWARDHVARLLALGILDVYPNHTFQPGATVRRVDLARAVARVLDRLAWPPAAAPAPSDMSRAHLDYRSVERVLGAGLMGLSDSGAFEPWRPVSGGEAVAVVDGAARLAGR